MTQVEFEAWRRFYIAQPFDDFHRFHRPAAMVAHAMAGGSVEERLRWLQPPPPVAEPEGADDGWSQADRNTFRAFGVKPPKRVH